MRWCSYIILLVYIFSAFIMAPKRARTPTWTWWDEVTEVHAYKTGGTKRWDCKYCSQRKTGSSSRIRSHLLHIPGQEIAFCNSISSEQREELRKKEKDNQPTPTTRRIGSGVDPTSFVGSSQVTGTTISSFFGSTAIPCGAPPIAPKVASMRQSTIPSRWDPKKKEAVDATVGHFFYHNAITFQTARNMVLKIANFGPTYNLPTSEALRTTILSKEVETVRQATEIVRASWDRNGISLITDRWNDTRS